MYDKLVAVLRRCGRLPCEGCPRKMCEGVLANMREAADAIEELSRAQEQWIEQERDALLKSIPRWIPVTERLPEERDYYLAMTEDCEVWVCEFLPGVKQWWIVPSDDLILSVTHWQKLPEPPKEETK